MFLQIFVLALKKKDKVYFRAFRVKESFSAKQQNFLSSKSDLVKVVSVFWSDHFKDLWFEITIDGPQGGWSRENLFA